MVTLTHNQGDEYCATPSALGDEGVSLSDPAGGTCVLPASEERVVARPIECGADRSLTAPSAIHSSFTSSRRRPNKTESIDQQPGPSIAIAAQTQMNRIPSFGGSMVIKVINTSSTAARVPATGVHSPISRSPPGIVEMSASEPKLRVPGTAIAVIPFVSKYPPDAIRSTSRPAPGHPFGKIENRRCKEVSPFCSQHYL